MANYKVSRNFEDRKGKIYKYRCSVCYQKRQSPFPGDCQGKPDFGGSGTGITSPISTTTSSTSLGGKEFNSHTRSLGEKGLMITKRALRQRKEASVS